MQIHTADFITWVKAQPPLAEFNWQYPNGCATCLYLRSVILTDISICALINHYYVGGVKYYFPEVLQRTWKRFSDDANFRTVYLVSYGRLASEIDISYQEMSRAEMEMTENSD